MQNAISVKLKPYEFYTRYEGSELAQCGIEFFLYQNGKTYPFRSATSDTCIKEMLEYIDDYLCGRMTESRELFFFIPWIMGDFVIFPYSFRVDIENDTWEFRYKSSQNYKDFEYVQTLTHGDIMTLREQLSDEYARVDWKTLGKRPLYRFGFANRNPQWSYSATELCNILSGICKEKSIKDIYVGASNYANPLDVRKNYVNYYLGSEIIIQLDAGILELDIYGEGLFRWQLFDIPQYKIFDPYINFISDKNEEFCRIDTVYDSFTGEYRNSKIKKVTVDVTSDISYSARGFDENKLGDPVEVAESVHLHLANGFTLSFLGYDDDFAIELSTENGDEHPFP